MESSHIAEGSYHPVLQSCNQPFRLSVLLYISYIFKFQEYRILHPSSGPFCTQFREESLSFQDPLKREELLTLRSLKSLLSTKIHPYRNISNLLPLPHCPGT